MKKRLKTTWNDIAKILPRDANHPATIMLSRSHGQRMSLPVRLRKGDDTVLTATVKMLPHPDREALDLVALSAIYEKLRQHDIMIDWDNALVGDKKEPYDRLAFLDDHGLNRQAANYLRKPLGASLRSVENLRKAYKAGNNGKDLPYNEVLDLRCAAIIGSTVTVESAQIRDILLERESWFRRNILKPRGLEV